MPRMIATIAREIEGNWNETSKNGVNYAAKPYLDAMKTVYVPATKNGIKGVNYGMDSVDSIIRYFLGNANSYRGPVAREHKDELKALL